MVVLGGIGVWSVTRVFMRQKMKTIAVLKCLGCTTRQVLATYLAQVLALGLAGSVLGAAMAWVAVRAIPASVTDALGAGHVGLTPGATLQGLGVGLLVSTLFAAVPLLEARHVRPLLLLRQDAERRRRGVPRRAAGHGARRARPARRRGARRRGRRPGGDRRLAGGIAEGRAPRVRRLRRDGRGAARARRRRRAGRRAAGAALVVPAAPRRAGPAAAGQPDPRDPAGGGPRQLLRPRGARPRGQPAGRDLGAAPERRAGSLPDRRPARPGRGGARARREEPRRRERAGLHSRAARARHRRPGPHAVARRRGGRAGPRLARARVRGDLARRAPRPTSG